jgi:hypothetical protein
MPHLIIIRWFHRYRINNVITLQSIWSIWCHSLTDPHGDRTPLLGFQSSLTKLQLNLSHEDQFEWIGSIGTKIGIINTWSS